MSLICQLISKDNYSLMFLMLYFFFISPLDLVIRGICYGSSFTGLCYKSGHSHSIFFYTLNTSNIEKAKPSEIFCNEFMCKSFNIKKGLLQRVSCMLSYRTHILHINIVKITTAENPFNSQVIVQIQYMDDRTTGRFRVAVTSDFAPG